MPANKLIKYIAIVGFTALGVLSFLYAFRDYGVKQIAEEASKISLWWLVPVYLSGLMGSLARAWRWKMVLDANSETKVKVSDSLYALMFGYFVNLGTPRLGELSRCLYLNRSAKINSVYSIGTVAIERSIDVLCLLISLFITLFLNGNAFADYFNMRIVPALVAKFGFLKPYIPYLVVLGLISLAVLYFLSKRKWRQNFVLQIVQQLKSGIIAIIRLKNPMLYILFTLAIWFSYFLTSYLWLLAFGYSGTDAIIAGFTIMSVGAIAKSLPIQGGGIGAYHVLVSEIMQLFAITGIGAITYATINHGSQIVYNLFFGLLSLLMMRSFKAQSA